MRRSHRTLLLLAILIAGVPAAAPAHFKLLEPTSAIIENERGDPQKAYPCGVDASSKSGPSKVVNTVTGGQKLRIRVEETIYHPGHYRVALAVNSRDRLPPDPEVTTSDTDKGPRSVSAVIQNPARIPVLADGLFVHTSRPLAPFETEVQLPNIDCPNCVLQVVQFMAEHGYNNPGGYSYHHCADLQIIADPKKPIDTEWVTAP